MQACDRLLLNATIINAQGKQLKEQAIAISEGMIVWCGAMSDLPVTYLQQAAVTEDCYHLLITPGLIDCHTHLVYAGNRADEFKQRLEGKLMLKLLALAVEFYRLSDKRVPPLKKNCFNNHYPEFWRYGRKV